MSQPALATTPTHEPSLLGLFHLHRTNWLRRSRTSQDILGELLAARPASIEGLIAGTSADVDDGQLRSARDRLSRLEAVAPGRREVRTLRHEREILKNAAAFFASEYR